MGVNKSQILLVLKQNIKKIVSHFEDERFSVDLTMAEMGLDSLDSVQVLFGCMKDLKIKLLQNNSLHKLKQCFLH